MKLLAVMCLALLTLEPAQLGQVTVRSPGPPGGVDEPLAVLNAERAWSGADVFWLLLNNQDIERDDRHGAMRRYAIRAIGRVEDPAQVRPLLALPGALSSTTADAIAQSLHGFDPDNDSRLIADVATAFRQAVQGAPASTRSERAARAASLERAMSHIAYATDAQVRDVELSLADGASYAASSSRLAGIYLACIRGLEALARVNTKLVHYDDDTIEILAKAAVGDTVHGNDPGGRLDAFMALVNARALTAEVEQKALKDDDWTVRRAAAAVLAGSGGGLEEDATLLEIRHALGDASGHVRYEAVRAWARFGASKHGCQPIVQAIGDEDTSVALQALDLLGTLCLEDEQITKRVVAETTVPSNADWQRPTHAFVALAKRSPADAAIHMEAFTTHSVWWVRMYAAFAAFGARDLLRLDRLAYDDNDNVRDAALPYLRRLDPERAERAVLAALDRTDVQLIHTAAGMIKEWPASERYVTSLVASLDRLTKEHSMSSRDGRVALLDAIEHHATSRDQARLMPWLRDYDPVVANRAADVILHLSGTPVKAEPSAAPHVPTQPFDDLRQCVVVDMSPGRPFHMRMNPGAAPIAVEQFLKLATIDRYYDGLTIHRVVPNFVIQGGSPGANEYSGAKEFLRDEIDAGANNVRGSVGLSIRGRNTGDAQFFVNLVDNPRLDGGYTVFANVVAADMEVVDRIQEGDVMRSIRLSSCQ